MARLMNQAMARVMNQDGGSARPAPRPVMVVPRADRPPGYTRQDLFRQDYGPRPPMLTNGSARPDTPESTLPPESPRASIMPVATSLPQAIMATASGSNSSPVVGAPATSPTLAAQPQPGGATPLLAGAGAGFLLGGPVGAAIGAGAAYFLTRPKATASVPVTPTSQFAHFSHPAFGEAMAYGSFWSSIKKAASGVTKAVKSVGRAVDLSSSKSLFAKIPVAGPLITKVSRMGVGTAAAVVTGGASVWAGQKGYLAKSTFGTKNVVQGFATGAAVGAAILSGGTLAKVAATGLSSVTSGMAKPQAPAQTVPVAVDQGAVAAQPSGGGGGNMAAILAGAGAGLLLGGPIGAAAGGIAGAMLGRQPATQNTATPVSGFGRAADTVMWMRANRR